ncbi:MAG: NUDIX hydrolase [Gammaproteobacteria bacterium]
MAKPRVDAVGHWTVRHSHTLYDNEYFRLRRDACELPGGSALPRYYVWEVADWANVIALTAQRELVLVRQYRHGAGCHFYEFPGGVIETAEADTPASAAARELREETGYVPGRLEALGALYPNPALQNNRLHVFLALDCARVGPPELEPGEDLVTELVDLDAYLRDNGLGLPRHALMLAAFTLAVPRLHAIYPDLTAGD